MNVTPNDTPNEREDGAAPPEPLMGALLRIPYTVMGEATERGLAAAGYGDIRRSHLLVLQPLFSRPDGARMTDLAAWAHITKPSMVYLVNHLEAHGYVTRSADAEDGRAQRVRLTPRGLQATRTVRELVRQTEADWASRIGADRLATLRQLLRDLALSLRADDQSHW